eukprot:g979.t1
MEEEVGVTMSGSTERSIDEESSGNNGQDTMDVVEEATKKQHTEAEEAALRADALLNVSVAEEEEEDDDEEIKSIRGNSNTQTQGLTNRLSNDSSSSDSVADTDTTLRMLSPYRSESADSIGAKSEVLREERRLGDNKEDDDRADDDAEDDGVRESWWKETKYDHAEESKMDENDVTCAVCDERGKLLCCDGPCKRSFHLNCVNLLPEEVPEGEWICADCSNEDGVDGAGGSISNGVGVPATSSNEANGQQQQETMSKLEAFFQTRAPVKGAAALNAMRGFDLIMQTLQSSDGGLFDVIGRDVMELVMRLSVTSEARVRERVLPFADRVATRWKATHKNEILQASDETRLSRIVDLSIGVYFLEQGAMSHPLKKKLETLIRRRTARVDRFLGFDPRGSSSNPIPDERQIYKFLTHALMRAHYLDALNFDVGADYLDVYRWVKLARPYVDHDKAASVEDYEQQLFLVSAVVMTMTDFGKLSVDAAFLPYEHEWLTRDRTFTYWMDEMPNPRAVGLLVQACRCLGIPEDQKSNPPMQRAIQWIMDKQRDDGGWDVALGRDKYADQKRKTREEILATAACVQGLLQPVFRGCGPRKTTMLSSLRKQAKKLRASRAASALPKILPCGIERKSLLSTTFAFVRHLYEDGGAGSTDGLGIAERGKKRLDDILMRLREEEVADRNRRSALEDSFIPRKRRKRSRKDGARKSKQ